MAATDDRACRARSAGRPSRLGERDRVHGSPRAAPSRWRRPPTATADEPRLARRGAAAWLGIEVEPVEAAYARGRARWSAARGPALIRSRMGARAARGAAAAHGRLVVLDPELRRRSRRDRRLCAARLRGRSRGAGGRARLLGDAGRATGPCRGANARGDRDARSTAARARRSTVLAPAPCRAERRRGRSRAMTGWPAGRRAGRAATRPRRRCGSDRAGRSGRRRCPAPRRPRRGSRPGRCCSCRASGCRSLVASAVARAVRHRAGGALPRRLMAGALRLEPDEVRARRRRRLLGRVLESDAVAGPRGRRRAARDAAAVELVLGGRSWRRRGRRHPRRLALGAALAVVAGSARRYVRTPARWTEQRLDADRRARRGAWSATGPGWPSDDPGALERRRGPRPSSAPGRVGAAWTARAGGSALVPRCWLPIGRARVLAPAFVAGGPDAPRRWPSASAACCSRPSDAGPGRGAGPDRRRGDRVAAGWRRLCRRGDRRAGLGDDPAPARAARPRRPALLDARGRLRPPAPRRAGLAAVDLSVRAGRSSAARRRLRRRQVDPRHPAGRRPAPPTPVCCSASGLDRARSAPGLAATGRIAPAVPREPCPDGDVRVQPADGPRLAAAAGRPGRGRGRVCRALGLGPLLDRMPAGLFQMVGETGWQLSHGERSRLYLARALLQGADLIILDESFGALDPTTLHQTLTFVLDEARPSWSSPTRRRPACPLVAVPVPPPSLASAAVNPLGTPRCRRSCCESRRHPRARVRPVHSTVFIASHR